MLAENKLSAGHARALLSISDERKREEVAAMIISKGLSVRETEKLIQNLNRRKKKYKAVQSPATYWKLNLNWKISGHESENKLGAKKELLKSNTTATRI